MSEPRLPLILDVDTGVDDALALALAVRSPRVDLVAVTTVAGNVGIEHTTANTLTVLDHLGAIEVPVHRGASRPLVRPHEDAAFVHGTNGLGDAALPASNRPLGHDRGPAAIVRLAHARPGELTLVCVGPLTNLAIALNVEPRLPDLLAGLVIMGGAFGVRGNITEHAEYNIYVDPEAAAQVFATSFPRMVAVGLDVSHQTALPFAVWEATRALESADPVAELVVQVCRRTFTERDVDGFYLHDPLALAVALNPSLITVEDVAVAVRNDDAERGRTVTTPGGHVGVARAVDARRFLAGFYDTLGLPALDVDQRTLRPE